MKLQLFSISVILLSAQSSAFAFSTLSFLRGDAGAQRNTQLVCKGGTCSVDRYLGERLVKSKTVNEASAEIYMRDAKKALGEKKNDCKEPFKVEWAEDKTNLKGSCCPQSALWKVWFKLEQELVT